MRKDWKAVAEEMEQVGCQRRFLAHPPEKLMAEKPRWEKSNHGKEGTGVASQWSLNHGKSKCGFPRGTGHHHEGERDDLGKNPSG